MSISRKIKEKIYEETKLEGFLPSEARNIKEMTEEYLSGIKHIGSDVKVSVVDIQCKKYDYPLEYVVLNKVCIIVIRGEVEKTEFKNEIMNSISHIESEGIKVNIVYEFKLNEEVKIENNLSLDEAIEKNSIIILNLTRF